MKAWIDRTYNTTHRKGGIDMKIVVLAGGLSPERDVSLSSGAMIANALMESGHDVLLLDLYLGKDNREIEPVYRNSRSGHRFTYAVPEKEPDLAALRAAGGPLVGNGVVELCKEADKVFLGLHGSVGENGQLQALLDLYGIPYTGTGYEGSLLAMDKDLSKKLIRIAGVHTPDWVCWNLKQKNVLEGIQYPCVVKPRGCGSSIGVTIVENSSQLNTAIEAARRYEDFILIEKKVEGREFSVGILGGQPLPAIEIKPLSGFYDYKNKYQQGLTEEVCPAEISPELEALLEQEAKTVHDTLRLGYYSRVDFIVDKENRLYCLEANTLPGMTPTSLLPQEALAVGISYPALCDKIVMGK